MRITLLDINSNGGWYWLDVLSIEYRNNYGSLFLIEWDGELGFDFLFLKQLYYKLRGDK